MPQGIMHTTIRIVQLKRQIVGRSLKNTFDDKRVLKIMNIMFIVSLHQNNVFLLYFGHLAYNQLDCMIFVRREDVGSYSDRTTFGQMICVINLYRIVICVINLFLTNVPIKRHIFCILPVRNQYNDARTILWNIESITSKRSIGEMG